jgi:hypothetical protein
VLPRVRNLQHRPNSAEVALGNHVRQRVFAGSALSVEDRITSATGYGVDDSLNLFRSSGEHSLSLMGAPDVKTDPV